MYTDGDIRRWRVGGLAVERRRTERLLRLSGNLPRKEGGYFFFLDGFFSEKKIYTAFLTVERIEVSRDVFIPASFIHVIRTRVSPHGDTRDWVPLFGATGPFVSRAEKTSLSSSISLRDNRVE